LGNHLWIREYQNGLVITNPSTKAKTISVSGNYKRIRGNQDQTTNSGQAVGSSLTIPANDGLILLRAGNYPTSPPPSTPTPTSGQSTPTPASAPTSTPTSQPSVPVPLSQFKTGWNYLTWQSNWPTNFEFSSLPIACPYVIYFKDNWFYSFVREYNAKEYFVRGQAYSVFCSEDVYWGMK